MSRDAQTWFRKLRIGLNPVEKLIGGELAYRAEDDTHHAWPTRSRLSDDTEVPVRTVARALAALEEKGLITRVGTKEATNAVIWRMNVEVEITAKLAHSPSQTGTPPQAKMAHPPQAKMAHTKLTIESSSQVQASSSNSQARERAESHDDQPSLLSSERPSPRTTIAAKKASVDPMKGFDAFYRAYPRKVGRGAAERAWMSAIRSGATLETICAGLQWQIPKLREADPEFRPHPATWLNGKRYLDEPPAHLRPGYRQRMGSYEPSPEGGYDDPADDPGAMNGGF